MSRARILAWFPWLLTGTYGLLILIPATREFAYRAQKEDAALEQLTLVLLLLAGLFALRAAWRGKAGTERRVLAVGGLLLLVAAGEEAAWGQHLFGGPLSERWAAANEQGETTIHNLGPLHGKSELFYMVATIAALIGSRASLRERLGASAVPRLLIPGLVLVLGFAIVEVAVFLFLEDPRPRRGMGMMAEAIEMSCGYLAILWSIGAWSSIVRRDLEPARVDD